MERKQPLRVHPDDLPGLRNMGEIRLDDTAPRLGEKAKQGEKESGNIDVDALIETMGNGKKGNIYNAKDFLKGADKKKAA